MSVKLSFPARPELGGNLPLADRSKSSYSIGMRSVLMILAFHVIAGCAPEPSASVTALADRLAVEGGASSQDGSREHYVACGTEALSAIPATNISRALTAPDVPSIWATLGDAALDRYVKVCRGADLKAGLQPRK